MAQAPAVAPLKQYRYYDFITATFVTVLLCSNLIGPAKICQIGEFTFGAGILFFPITYLFGDILTEVYGYARARRVVWTGFGALAFASLMSVVVLRLPPAPGYPHQGALETVFAQTPRIVLASLAAFWVGEFANSFALAKMKLRQRDGACGSAPSAPRRWARRWTAPSSIPSPFWACGPPATCWW